MDEVRDNIYIAKKADMQSLNPAITPADEYDVVIGLADDPVDGMEHHVPLIDGVNVHHEFVEAVETVISAIQQRESDDESVVVFCNAGQSRSACVLATALASVYETGLDEQIDAVESAHDPTSIREPLREHAKEYLGTGDLAKYLDESVFDRDVDVIFADTDTNS